MRSGDTLEYKGIKYTLTDDPMINCVDYTMDADAVDEEGEDCLITWPLFDDWYRHESRNTMCDWADIKRIEY